MLDFRYNETKAIAVVLYVVKSIIDYNSKMAKPDFHKISKVLYFADQKHILKYGRPISGDCYVAMKHGPVPSRIYDIIKVIKGQSNIAKKEEYSKYFEACGYFLYPKQNPDMDEISESELECLDESMKENMELTFDELSHKSHDCAYEKSDKDDRISFQEMAIAANADDVMLQYMIFLSENDAVFQETAL